MGDDTLSFLPDRSIPVGEAVHLDDALEGARLAPWASFEGGDDRHVAVLAVSPDDAGPVFLVGFDPEDKGWVAIDGWDRDADDLAAALRAATDEWLSEHYDDGARDELVIAEGEPFE